MKTKTLLILAIILCAYNAHSQHYALDIINMNTGDSKTFEVVKKATVKTFNNQVYRGTLTAHSDSSLLIGTSIVSIDSIRLIRLKNPFIRTTGNICLIAGPTSAVLGSLISLRILEQTGNVTAIFPAIIGVGAGAVSLVIGIILKSIRLSYPDDQFLFTIIDIESATNPNP